MVDGQQQIPDRAYDLFISYSHAADNRTAAQLQRALQSVAKPWYRLRGMRVFRDETDLSATPEGWPAVQRALASSRFFLLMASREAASSKWVAREVDYWLKHRSIDNLLIVLTDGEIVWDDRRGDFDWERTTGLPRQLSEAFRNEPFWADLKWTNEQQILTLRNPEFLRAVAKLAAPVRGLEVAAIVSEDHKQHQRTLRVAGGAAIALIVFLGVAIWQYQARLAAAERERDQMVLTEVARAYQVLYIDPLQAVDEAHQSLVAKETPEGVEALRLALEVSVRRRESRASEREVLGSGVGYLMERWRQGDVFTKLRRDGRYALVASERGKDGPKPPGTVYLIRLDNLRTTELLPGEQARGRRLEYMGFSASGREIFVARQFYLDIHDLEGKLIKSVQLEYHAKPTHLIAGMFGSYVLVGDTVGHLMLADTESDKRPQLRSSRHRDAAVFFETNAAGTLAIVIFESGRSDLIVLDDLAAPVEHELATEGIVHAEFGPAAQSDRFLTTSKTGRVDVWRFTGARTGSEGRPYRVSSFTYGNTAVGLASFSSDGQRIISLDDKGAFQITDAATGSHVVSYP